MPLLLGWTCKACSEPKHQQAFVVRAATGGPGHITQRNRSTAQHITTAHNGVVKQTTDSCTGRPACSQHAESI
jgi:hypothetical protein